MSGVVWQHQGFANIQVSFHLGGFLFLVSLPEAPPCRSRGRLPDLLSNLFLSTLPPCASINRTIKFLSHRLSHRLCSNDAHSTKTNTAGYMFSIDFNGPLKKTSEKTMSLRNRLFIFIDETRRIATATATCSCLMFMVV